MNRYTKISKSMAIALSCALIFTLCLVETGCTQAQFDANVQKIEAQIPNLVNTAGSIAALTGNADLGQVMQQMAATATADLAIVQTAGDAYLANKSSSNKKALIAAATTLASNVNAAVLRANGIKSAESETTALKALAVFSIGINGLAIALGANVIATNHRAVRPLVPRDEEERVAESYGATLAQFGL